MGAQVWAKWSENVSRKKGKRIVLQITRNKRIQLDSCSRPFLFQITRLPDYQASLYELVIHRGKLVTTSV